MGHFALTQSNWASYLASDPSDLFNSLESLESKIQSAVNGDEGGCWAPSSPIVILGIQGMTISGPLVVFSPTTSSLIGGSLNSASIAFETDFPALGPGHSGSTHVFVQDTSTSMATPAYVGLTNLQYAACQAAAPSIAVWPNTTVFNPVQHVIPLFAHDGATLTAVSLSLIVPTPHNSVPTVMPTVRLVCCDYAGNVLNMTSEASGADVTGTFTLPAPATGAAWYNGAQAQSFSIPVDQNNVIANSDKLYYAIVTDEQGGIEVPVVPVDYATTAPINTLFEGTGISVDGFTPGVGSLVLIKDQIDPAQNGVYLVRAGNWQRPVGALTATDLMQGSLVYVESGSANANTLWQQTSGDVQQITGYPSWTPATAYPVGSIVSPIAQTITVYGVASVTVALGGSGYPTPPAIAFTGVCTRPAKAHATMNYSVDSVVNIPAGGSYTSTPTAVPVGGNPTSAATFGVTLGSFTYGVQTGPANLTGYGAGYFQPPITNGSGTTTYYGTVPPLVSFSGGGGTGAQGYATVGILDSTGDPNDPNNYGVTGIVITEAGSGYTSNPVIVLTAQSAGIDPNSGNPLPAVGSGASGTVVLGSVTSAQIASVSVISGGGNYQSRPAIQISGGGGPTVYADAVMSGSVSGIVIDDSGAGYVSTPTAAIAAAPAGGTNATVNTVTLTAGSPYVSPKPAPGLCFVATAISGTGTSFSVEPEWPTVTGQTVIDNPGGNQITWTAQSDPGADLVYGTQIAMPYNANSGTLVPSGTIFLSLSLTYSDIIDCRWQ